MSLNDKTLAFKEMTENRKTQDKRDRPDARRDGTNSRPRRLSGAPQGPNPRCAAPLPQDGVLSAIYIMDNDSKAKRLFSFRRQM